jgi:hypothetical protein
VVVDTNLKNLVEALVKVFLVDQVAAVLRREGLEELVLLGKEETVVAVRPLAVT